MYLIFALERAVRGVAGGWSFAFAMPKSMRLHVPRRRDEHVLRGNIAMNDAELFAVRALQLVRRATQSTCPR